MSEGTYECLVVGAGISGLVAARELTRAGIRVLVIDKGRGVGGRMATRRVHGVACDHGAQFITVRDARFRRLMDRMIVEGVAGIWSHGFAADGSISDHDPMDVPGDGHPRYRGIPSMTGIPKWLAQGLDVRTSMRAEKIDLIDGTWYLDVVKEGAGVTMQIDASSLLITAPAEQALNLLHSGNYQLPADAHASLAAIQYDPCFAVMAVFAGPTRVPAPGGIKFPRGGAVSWIADNQQKGIAEGRCSVTIHASGDFTRKYYDTPKDEVGRMLLREVERWLPLDQQPQAIEVHRWRYSIPTVMHPQPCMMVHADAPLVLAGDAFAGPRVEGAALSGMAAAHSLWERLSSAGLPREARRVV